MSHLIAVFKSYYKKSLVSIFFLLSVKIMLTKGSNLMIIYIKVRFDTICCAGEYSNEQRKKSNKIFTHHPFYSVTNSFWHTRIYALFKIKRHYEYLCNHRTFRRESCSIFSRFFSSYYGSFYASKFFIKAKMRDVASHFSKKNTTVYKLCFF